MADQISFERMSAPLGAVVHDLDVREVTPAQWQQLNELFCEHHVLVFRDQVLSPADHMAFGERWGKLVCHPYAATPEWPAIIELRNQGKRRDINQHWHSDMTFNVAPPKLTMLHALEAPGLGGDTAFANQVLAWELLSDGLKETLGSLTAVHTAAGLADVYGQDADKAPRAEHPVGRVHDESGKRALFVCRAFTRNFVGWTQAESRPLLDFLFRHAIREELQARHTWQKGDLVMWDNRAVQHFAVHDHGDAPRVIHRIQVEGPIPG